jgi:hypothetical protein
MTDHWFEPLADHMGTAYDRYAHTKGTVQEVDHVVAALGLASGARVLDIESMPTVSTSVNDSSTLRPRLRAPSRWRQPRLHEGMLVTWGSPMNSTP